MTLLKTSILADLLIRYRFDSPLGDHAQGLITLIPPLIQLFQTTTCQSGVAIPIHRVDFSHVSLVINKPAFVIGRELLISHTVDATYIRL